MISIIVPMHNVEQYLGDCIHSVGCQTYQDYELLLVNDGSTDETETIAERFASHDRRIRVFRCQRSHASGARNYGLDHARGEYITFLDADDTLHPEAFKTLVEAALRYRATIVMAGHYENQLIAPHYDLPHPLRATPDQVMGPRKTLRAFINGELRTAVWAALYQRELFDTLRFSNRPCAEDAFLMPMLLTSSQRTVAIAPCVYFYRRRLGSITLTMTPSRTHGPAARIDLYRYCRASYPLGKLRAMAMAGIINSTWSLALQVVEQAAYTVSWRRRIYNTLPRTRLLLFCCHPLISLRARVLGSSLLLGLRPNAWVSHRLRSVYHLLGRGRRR
ncbi:MAG: glycosyltransferase family 2 protein [Actinomycetota bacterium]